MSLREMDIKNLNKHYAYFDELSALVPLAEVELVFKKINNPQKDYYQPSLRISMPQEIIPHHVNSLLDYATKNNLNLSFRKYENHGNYFELLQ